MVASSRNESMKLRPYQQEVARAVTDSVLQGKGLTFSVEIARQGGKNELSAHLEVLLLTLYMAEGGALIKCSPTFKPQAVISLERLRERLDEFGFHGIYQTRMSYVIGLGAARAVFLSAEPSSSVVGHTADILLEVDESQDVDKRKYTKEFRPMGSNSNVTTIHYGTTWDDSTLLEEIKQMNLEQERKDGIKRHFRYDWQEVAKCNPDYLNFVLAEKERLGENHPLFLTQYALLPIPGRGKFLSRQQIALMQGRHQRLSQPEEGKAYVAGVDLAGEGADATVVTIAELNSASACPPSSPLTSSPVNGEGWGKLKVMEHYQWRGISASQLYPQVIDVLKRWSCRRIVVDATGMGQPLASFLRARLGRKVIPITFTQKRKSEMGFELLAFINSGRLKLYTQDGSLEYQELMFELERARAQYRPNQTINFFVDSSEGHDDFLVSLALVVQAGNDFHPREAKGWLRSS